MSITINHQTNDISATSGSLTIDGAAVGVYTAGVERISITSAGRVGIGKSDPASTLHVVASTDPGVEVDYYASSTGGAAYRGRKGRGTAASPTAALTNDYLSALLASGYGSTGFSPNIGLIGFRASQTFTDAAHGNYITFQNTPDGSTNRTERMRIDSSGNVGIGTSSPSEALTVVGNGVFGDVTTKYNRITINGGHVGDGDNDYGLTINSFEPAITLLDRSTGAGSSQIYGLNNGGILFRGDTTNDGTIGHTANITDFDIARFEPTVVRLFTNNTERMRIDSSGNVYTGADNTQTLGTASLRWSVVYAGTGTINTSDEREKQQISALDDAERRVAVAIKGLVKKYKYNDAVALKGQDARIHVGVIAQEVVAAFAAEGLDATRYALLCHDTWEAEPEELDEEGNVTSPGRDVGERYGIRYEELLTFMIAAL